MSQRGLLWIFLLLFLVIWTSCFLVWYPWFLRLDYLARRSASPLFRERRKEGKFENAKKFENGKVNEEMRKRKKPFWVFQIIERVEKGSMGKIGGGEDWRKIFSFLFLSFWFFDIWKGGELFRSFYGLDQGKMKKNNRKRKNRAKADIF